jgi:hypothetical protein
VASIAASCSSEVPERPGTPQTPGDESPAQMQVLGEFIGHWSATTGRITFEPVRTAEGQRGGVQPLGFTTVQEGTLEFSTPDVVIGPLAGWHNGTGCAANRLCAIVRLENLSAGRPINNVFVEITSITAGFAGANSVAVPTGYPLNNTRGLWNYGNLPQGGGNEVRWDFSLPNDEDFTFQVRVAGMFLRDNYVFSTSTVNASQNVNTAAWSDAAPAWRDACAFPSHTTELVNATTPLFSSDIALPFPFALYSQTFDADSGNPLYISSAGALGLRRVTTFSNVNLPATSSLDFEIFGFWSDVVTGSDGVCYGIDPTSAMPNRRFVATWRNASLASLPGSRLSFSIVLEEGTDRVRVLYNRWSSTSVDCEPFDDEIQGSRATVGIQGRNSVGDRVATVASFNRMFLPFHPFQCPGPGYAVTFTPTL